MSPRPAPTDDDLLRLAECCRVLWLRASDQRWLAQQRAARGEAIATNEELEVEIDLRIVADVEAILERLGRPVWGW